MDYRERESLCRRITCGKTYTSIEYQYESIEIIISDPLPLLLLECDFYYNKLYKDLTEEDELPTLEDTFEILKKQKIWTPKMSDELEQLPIAIKQFNKQLSTMQFKKNQQRAILKSIKKAKERLEELNRIKTQLYGCTVEYVCQQDRYRRLLPKITEFVDSSKKPLLENISFLSSLSVLYGREVSIEEAKMREASRSDPWRLYYTVSKNTSTPLFSHPTTSLTEWQSLLLAFSRVYDFAFESSRRPSEEVINDDEKFSVWYSQELETIKREVQENKSEEIGKKNAGEEIFLLTDDPSGIKEILDLNSPQSRNTIKQREKQIREKGQVNETELFDVKQRLQMQGTNQAANTILNR